MFFLSVFLCNFGRRIFEIEGDNIQDCVCISLTQKRVSGSEKFLLMTKKRPRKKGVKEGILDYAAMISKR